MMAFVDTVQQMIITGKKIVTKIKVILFNFTDCSKFNDFGDDVVDDNGNLTNKFLNLKL